MRVQFRKYLLTLTLLVMAAAAPVCAAAKGWEPIKTERADAKHVARDAEFEIKSASKAIIVSTNHPMQIKIFTILGRLVSSDTIPQGTSQFILPAHGVYIVKIGDLTCKVAV